jgi:hypothetical protein
MKNEEDWSGIDRLPKNCGFSELSGDSFVVAFGMLR